MAKLKTGKMFVALMLSMAMAASVVAPALGVNQLATPQVTQNQNYRWLFYIPVNGATAYNVYAFTSYEAAQAGANYVAVSRNIIETPGSTSTGGTTGGTAPQVPEGHNRIDVRLIKFEGTATRELPEGYTAAGFGDSFYPGDRQGDTTNLKPGQYWFRMRAVSDDDSIQDSAMSEVLEFPLSIAMGPDEARAFIEANLDLLGTTPDAMLRLIDLRGPTEFSDEGNVRFFDEADRYVWADFDTLEKAEAIFGHVYNKSAVSILVL